MTVGCWEGRKSYRNGILGYGYWIVTSKIVESSCYEENKVVLIIVVASTGMVSSPSVQIGQKLNESIWTKLCHLIQKVSNVSRGVSTDVKILIPCVWNATEGPKHINCFKTWSNQLEFLR